VDAVRAQGLHRAREFDRAHSVAGLDRRIPEPVIMQVLSVGRTVSGRTRTAYLPGGVDFALPDAPRPGTPRQYEADVEAQIAALAGSAPRPLGGCRPCAGVGARPASVRQQPRQRGSALRCGCGDGEFGRSLRHLPPGAPDSSGEAAERGLAHVA
jgi:hypothetical protein